MRSTASSCAGEWRVVTRAAASLRVGSMSDLTHAFMSFSLSVRQYSVATTARRSRSRRYRPMQMQMQAEQLRLLRGCLVGKIFGEMLL
jgi:hypothetical protein